MNCDLLKLLVWLLEMFEFLLLWCDVDFFCKKDFFFILGFWVDFLFGIFNVIEEYELICLGCEFMFL